ncbi:MAG: AAA family ATPase [Tannerellaceae bacterium]|jgi:hypothetical protein|nr:AAA family ATPase [Tannerellaceae bacterium]
MESLKFQPQKFELANNPEWSTVFDEYGSFDNKRLYMLYFNTIPHLMGVHKINCQKANQWFLDNYKTELTNFHYIKVQNKDGKCPEYDDLYYTLYDDLMVYFDINNGKVNFLFRQTANPQVDAVLKGILSFTMKTRAPRRKAEIKLILNTSRGLDTKTMPVSKPKLSIEDNYNDDLQPVHQIILKRLSHKNDKGLVLLHGKPGTGKTSYIRYLISKTTKDIIFLPPNMASAITDPGLMALLIDNPNSIFVIEDAENIIIDRNKRGNSSVSALLNLADGLLSDFLNIQIICSFNTDLSMVDSALMRKGRLIAKYEFKELEIDKAQALSNKLGFSTTIDTPKTLTAIYNQDENDFQPVQRNTIGFKILPEQKVG